MKVSLAVPELTDDIEANLARVLDMVSAAARDRPDVVLFPEACLTGFQVTDDPTHDLALGKTIPGPETDRLSLAAREAGVWVALGMFERYGNRLFDSALLLSPDGNIAHKYRRISPGWHAGDASPDTYGHGVDITPLDAPFGRAAFLVCGDMFDDTLVDRARKSAPDCVLVPMARSFDDGTVDSLRWEQEEKPGYIAQAARLGATVFIANCLCLAGHDRSFGGALAISADGTLINSLPIGRPGFLTAEA